MLFFIFYFFQNQSDELECAVLINIYVMTLKLCIISTDKITLDKRSMNSKHLKNKKNKFQIQSLLCCNFKGLFK